MSTPPAEPSPSAPQPVSLNTLSSPLSIPLLFETVFVFVAFPGTTLFLLGSLTYLRDLFSFWVNAAQPAEPPGLVATVAALAQLDGGRVAGGLFLAGLLLYVLCVYVKVRVGPHEPTLWRGRDVRWWWQIGAVLWSALALLLAFTTLALWPHAFPTVYIPNGTTVIDGWSGALFLAAVVLSLFALPLFPVVFLRHSTTSHQRHTGR